MNTITRTRFVDRLFHGGFEPCLEKLWTRLSGTKMLAAVLCTFISGGMLHAQPQSDDTQTNTSETVWGAPIVVIGKDAELKEGESAEAVVVIGGSAKIHGKVENAAVVIGGDLDVDGEVGEAAVAVLGNVNAHAGAKIHGDAVAVGGKVDVEPGAKVSRTQQSVQLPELTWLRSWFTHCVLLLRPLSLAVGWVWVVAGIFLLFYLLIAAVFPKPVEACANELTRRPATSFLVGLLALLLIPFAILILAFTGVGLIVVPFILAAVFLGSIVGKVGLLEWLGFKVSRQFGSQPLEKPLLALLIGAAIILLLYLIPVLGLVTFAMTWVWGLGGAVMAAFGGLRREMPEKPAAPIVPAGLPPGPSTVAPPVSLAVEQPINPPATSNPGSSGIAEPGQPTTSGDLLKEATPVVHAHAPTAALAAPPVPEIFTYPRCGFWERMGAGFLDVVLICIAAAIVGPFTPLVALAYFAGMWTWKQTTIGGIVLGLKVARLDGKPVTFAVAIVRSLAAGFSIFVLFLGFLWIAWDQDKQGWHDKIAGTVVLKLPRGTPLVCI
jgi:uncharacterized RDD family membrane protein YckC